MKRYDLKHIIFHILIALYSIWVLVYSALIAIVLINTFGPTTIEMKKAFMVWIFLNLLMGSLLFIVIRLYSNRTIINGLVLYSYFIMCAAAVTTVLLIKIRA